MQHLGLLPVSTKAASKATKNGQHNHHSVDHSTRILSKLGNPSDLLRSSIVSAAELHKTARDPYLFHDVDIKPGATVAMDKGLSRSANSIPIARLYPELAEKLDVESKTTRIDGHKAVSSLAAVSSRSQPINHVSAPAVNKQLKDGVRQSLDVRHPATASMPSVVSNQFPLIATSSIQSSVELQPSNTPNLSRLMLDSVRNSTAVVSSPVIGYPWQTSVSGGSAASMVHTSPLLLSQALQGLLHATSVAQTASLPCLKFPAPRSEVSMPSTRPSQNAPLLPSLCDATACETGRTTVKPCLPMVRPQTVALSQSTSEDASYVKAQPCAACMVRPRPRPSWRHKADLRLRQKALDKTAWKIYSDHVARQDCNTDILPCGMSLLLFAVMGICLNVNEYTYVMYRI